MAAISDIIKYEGDNNTFIWKHPCEDFNTTTQLIVHSENSPILQSHPEEPSLIISRKTE